MIHSQLHIVLVAQNSTSERLKRTLGSALAQSYEPKTVWVVNANPSDKAFTLGLLEDLKAYPQVKLLDISGRGGEFYYRNQALKQADGGYIAFIGDMDVWENGKAAAQIRRLNEQADVAALFSNALILTETSHGVVGQSVFRTASADPRDWMLQKTIAYGSQALYRTDALRSIGGFDEKLSVYGDLDAMLRLNKDKNVLCVSDIPSKIHIPPLQNLAAQQYADNRYLLEKHLDFFLFYKRTAYAFYRILARQSAQNREWLMMLFYFFRAAVKQPLRAFARLFAVSLRGLWIQLNRLIRNMYISTAIHKLHFSLSKGNTQRPPKPLRRGREKKQNTTIALDHLKEHEFTRLTSMKFMLDYDLEYVKIPDYVSVIPNGMFFGCKRLLSVDIPATVTRIEAHAFQNCVRLKSVCFAHGSALESIGAYAFAGCGSLPEITLSNSLQSIGRGVFAGCWNLRSVAFSPLRGNADAQAGFPRSLRSIPRYAFAGCSALSRIEFQPGSMLTKIESRAFYRCETLEMLKITGDVTAIGSYVFAGCTQLTFLDMQTIDSVKTIGRHAFENCRSMANLYLPFAVTHIRPYTFAGCTSLTRVKIPQNCRHIGHRAFWGCRILKYVTLMDETTIYRHSSFPRQAIVAPYQPLDAAQAGRGGEH